MSSEETMIPLGSANQSSMWINDVDSLFSFLLVSFYSQQKDPFRNFPVKGKAVKMRENLNWFFFSLFMLFFRLPMPPSQSLTNSWFFSLKFVTNKMILTLTIYFHHSTVRIPHELEPDSCFGSHPLFRNPNELCDHCGSRPIPMATSTLIGAPNSATCFSLTPASRKELEAKRSSVAAFILFPSSIVFFMCCSSRYVKSSSSNLFASLLKWTIPVCWLIKQHNSLLSTISMISSSTSLVFSIPIAFPTSPNDRVMYVLVKSRTVFFQNACWTCLMSPKFWSVVKSSIYFWVILLSSVDCFALNALFFTVISILLFHIFSFFRNIFK